MTESDGDESQPGNAVATHWGRALFGWLLVTAMAIAVEQLWGWGRVLQAWRGLSGEALVAALLLLLGSYLLRAQRLCDYCYADRLGRLPVLRLTLIHNFMNHALPMRSGELAFPVLMQRWFGMPPLRSTPILLWFRLLDLHVLLTLLLVVVIAQLTGVVLGLIVGALVLTLPLQILPIRRWLLAIQQRRLATLAVEVDVRTTIVGRVLDALPDNRQRVLRSLFWTWLNWAAKLGALAWLLSSFLPDSPFVGLDGVGAVIFVLVAAVIAGDLTSVLPIHAPGGFGTYEAGVIAPLVAAGVALPEAASAAINLHLFILGAAAVAALLAWVSHRQFNGGRLARPDRAKHANDD